MKISQQQKLTLVNRTGKLEANKESRQDGLCDVINFKTLKKGNWHSFKLQFDSKGATYGCLDQAGNVTLFYLDKNRYTNVDVQVDSSNLTFIEKQTGYLAVSNADCSISIYSILSGNLIQQLKWHTFRIKRLQVNHISGYLLSVSSDNCTLWDINTYERRKSIFVKNTRYTQGCLTPAGEHLITLSQNGIVEYHNTDTLKIEKKEEIGLKQKQAHLDVSAEGVFIAICGDSNYCLIGRLDCQSGFDFELYELPNNIKSVKKIKFIRNSLLTLLGSDEKIYVLSAENNMEIVLCFELPSRKGIVDYDLNVDAKYLVVISTLGEKYVYDFHQLISNQKQYQKDVTMKKGSFSRQTLTRVDLDELKQTLFYQTKENQMKYANSKKQKNEAKINGETNMIMLDRVGGATPEIEIFVNGKRQDQYEIQNQKSSFLDREKLREFLSRFGYFPEKHRVIVWNYLLKLPTNYEAFDNLARKGLHPNYLNLKSTFPIQSDKLYYRTQRILSCLAHYCPVFAQLDYMPAFVFPFVKLLGTNETFCFEVILSFLVQWGQFFFEFAPNPPVSYIKAFMELLEYHEPQLHAQLNQNIPHTQLFNTIWSSLQVVLTDVLKREDWLCFIDFLVAHSEKPDLLLHILVSYFTYFKRHITSFTTGSQLLHFFQQDHQIRIQNLLKDALEYRNRTPPRIPQAIVLQDNLPLTSEQYPIFNFYPKFSLDQHKEIRDQIIQEELKATEKKRTLKELNTLQQQLKDLEKLYEDKQDALMRHERERREIITYEQEMRYSKLVDAERQVREERLEQMKKLEEESRKAIQIAENSRKADLDFIDQELQKKRANDNKFIASKMEEEAILNLELKTAGRINEVLNTKTKDQNIQSITLQAEIAQKRLDMKYKQMEQQIDQQIEEENIRQDHILQRKALQREIEDDISKQREIKGQLLAEEFERELKLAEIERDRRIQRIEDNEKIKQQEFLQLYKQQDDVLNQQQNQLFKTLQDKDLDVNKARQEERMRIIEQENRQKLYELEEHRSKIKDITSHLKRAEAEDQIQEFRNTMLQNQLEEEKRLQKEIEQIQKDRKSQRELQQDLEFKQQEFAQSEQYKRILKQNEQFIRRTEEEKYRDFQNKLSQQFDQQQQEEEMKNQKYQYSPSKQNTYNPYYQDTQGNYNQSGNYNNGLNQSNNYQYNKSIPNNGQYYNNTYNNSNYNNPNFQNSNNTSYPNQNEYSQNYLQDSINQHSSMEA
ncbi:hypothetical protein ABPG72_010346 [Tetrahymena utriculariae]